MNIFQQCRLERHANLAGRAGKPAWVAPFFPGVRRLHAAADFSGSGVGMGMPPH